MHACGTCAVEGDDFGMVQKQDAVFNCHAGFYREDHARATANFWLTCM
jgi:hypothetical protein